LGGSKEFTKTLKDKNKEKIIRERFGNANVDAALKNYELVEELIETNAKVINYLWKNDYHPSQFIEVLKKAERAA
ncbi:hypothetical protein HY945_04390, partial [Candidatus Gottesmanbacteria bacterium]|nr:hypothetical protein [Candidatus Gottesmanbacteria bacterium]